MPKGIYQRKPKTDEMRRKQSERQKGSWIGNKNPRWNGGVRSADPREVWKKKIFERDKYTCQKCGLCETLKGFMQADHIKLKFIYPELQLELSNGQTLCPNCHRRKTIDEDRIYKFFMKEKS